MSRFLDIRHAHLTPYTPGEQPRNGRFIKLNTNESPYPPSPEVIRALDADAVSQLRLYSDPDALELKLAIAERYGLTRDRVAVGNGSDEILAFSFMAFMGARSVAFPAISYGFYPVFSQVFGVRARPVPLRDDFTIDPADYLRPGENVVIANPNAPTGLALDLDAIRDILRAHPDDVVLIDEAYVDFGAQSACALLNEFENLLVVQTFSKSRSLAGGRVGFALGSRALIGDIETIRNSFNPYNLGRLPIRAAAAAMRDEAYFSACVERIVATRARTRARLLQMGCEVTDSLTNFLFVRLPGRSGQAAQAALREKGFLVRRFNQEPIQDYLRVTIGTDADMEAFCDAVRDLIQDQDVSRGL